MGEKKKGFVISEELAREQLITANMRYSCWCVRRFPLLYLLELEDAISEGYAALVKAVDTYDDKKGAGLKTHIRSMIKWHLTNIVNNQKVAKRRGKNNKGLIDMPERISMTALLDSGWGCEDEQSRKQTEALPEKVDFTTAFKLLKTARQKEVLKFHLYGFTLKEIASTSNVCRARIGQRIQKSIRELKNGQLDKVIEIRKKRRA